MADDYPGSAPVSSSTSGGDYPGSAPVSGGESEPSAYAKFASGYLPGAFERGIGVDQTLNDIGVGKYFPVFRDGKLSIGLPPNEELAAREKYLEDNNRGVTNTIKEIATDPVSWLPMEGGLMAAGAKQGALSAALGPTTDSKQNIGGRVIGTAEGGALGGVTGGIMKAIGGLKGGSTQATAKALKDEVLGASPPPMPKVNEVYEQAKKMGLSFTGKEKPEEIWDKIQTAVKNKVAKTAETIIPGGSDKESIWPVNTVLAISQMYGATKQAGGVLYDQAAKIGEKEELPAEEITGELDKFIKDMHEDAPLHAGIDPNFNSKLNRVRALREALDPQPDEAAKALQAANEAFGHFGTDEPKTLNGAQLIELNKAINSFYGAGGTGEQKNIPVNKLKSVLDSAVKKLSPDFQAAYSKANNYWRQNVIQNFQDSKALGKFWKPADYEALKAISKGIALPPDLKVRAAAMLNNIKTPEQMDILKNELPPQMYDRLRAAKFVTMMDEAGINSKFISKDDNYKLLSKSLSKSSDLKSPEKAAAIQALDAVKTFTEEMNKRGIRQLTPAELAESDERLRRAQSTIFSAATGHRLYAVRHAIDFITGKKPNAMQEGLSKYAKEVAKGAPKAVKPVTPYEPGKIPHIVIRPLATEEGKSTQ